MLDWWCLTGARLVVSNYGPGPRSGSQSPEEWRRGEVDTGGDHEGVPYMVEGGVMSASASFRGMVHGYSVAMVGLSARWTRGWSDSK